MAVMPTIALTIGATTTAATDVRKLAITVGRQNELDSFSPATLTGVLNNRHRKWEPGFVGGHDPKPGMVTQLTATIDAVDYPLFAGRAVAFPQQWQAAGADGYIGFTAIDELSKLSKLKLRGSTLDGARGAADGKLPVAWYSFDSDGASAGSSDDVVVADKIGGRNGVARGVIDWNQPSLLGSKLGNAVGLPAGGWIALPVEVGNILATDSSWLISFMFRRAENIARTGETIVHCGSGAGNCFRVVHNAAGKIQAIAPDGTTVSTLYRVGTGRTHHIGVRCAAGEFELFVDGVSQGVDTFGGTITANSPLLLGTNPGQGAFTEATYADCFIDEFMVFDDTLDDDSNYQILSDAMHGWPGDRTGERIARILAMMADGLNAAFLATTTNIEPGNSVLGADGWDEGTNVLEVIQRVAATEQGRFFIDHTDTGGTGAFTFDQRHHDAARYTDTGADAVFMDTPGEVVGGFLYIADGFGFDFDDRYIINRAQVSSPHLKGPVERADDTSIGTYTETTKQIQTLSRDHNEADAYAQSLIRKYKDPAMRLREFAFNPSRENSWATALTLKPGSLIEVFRNPRVNQAASTTLQQTYVVERVRHDIDYMKGVWVTTVFAVAFEQPSRWILGTSELGDSTVLRF